MTIHLSDVQATLLEAKAAAEGLSVEQWIQKLADSGNEAAKPERRTGAAFWLSERKIDRYLGGY